MTETISEDLLDYIKKTVDNGGGVVAYARSKHINRGHVSMAYNGEYISPTLRLAMGLPNRKPTQTCTCGEVHTVPWCTKKKGAPVPEDKVRVVYVEKDPLPPPAPKPKRAPRPKRWRHHYECGRGDEGATVDAEIRAEMEAAGCDSFTDYVDYLRGRK